MVKPTTMLHIYAYGQQEEVNIAKLCRYNDVHNKYPTQVQFNMLNRVPIRDEVRVPSDTERPN